MFFDNLTVKYITGPLVQEQSYYPFGLAMAAISDKALLKTATKEKFNAGNELEEGINYYNTFYRKYDPQLGRFTGVDIEAEQFAGINPYQFAGNNPVSFNDPMGDKYMDANGNVWHRADPLAGTSSAGLWLGGAGGDYFGDGSGGGRGGGGGGNSGSGAYFKSLFTQWAKDGYANVGSYWFENGQGQYSEMPRIFVYGHVKNGKWQTTRESINWFNGDSGGGRNFTNNWGSPLRLMQTGQGGNDIEEESSLLKRIWNSSIVRSIINDKYTFSFNLHADLIVGAGTTPVSFTFLTRGEAGLYFTPSANASISNGAAAGVNVSMNAANYTGNPDDIQSSFLYGGTTDISAAFGVGIEGSIGGSYSKVTNSNGFRGFGGSIGFGLDVSPMSGAEVRITEQFVLPGTVSTIFKL